MIGYKSENIIKIDYIINYNKFENNFYIIKINFYSKILLVSILIEIYK